jgi:hypothetical protein
MKKALSFLFTTQKQSYHFPMFGGSLLLDSFLSAFSDYPSQDLLSTPNTTDTQ